MAPREPDILVAPDGRGAKRPVLGPREPSERPVARDFPPASGRAAAPPEAGGAALNVVLFALTFASVLLTHARLPEEPLAELLAQVATSPARLVGALPFAAVLMAILAAHEAGHWLIARRHHIAQSLPFFIPAPMFLMFGTLGAVIVTRRPIATRQALLRMAAAGPWAGMAVALPAAIWGLSHSVSLADVAHSGPARMFGRSLLFGLLEDTFSPNGADILLHPVALAAWVGFFFTSLNLIPAAQLDGGHVAYALFPRGHRRLGTCVVVGLCVLGLGAFGGGPSTWMWVLWALVLGMMGLRHPPVVEPGAPLARADRRLGWASLVLFALTFVPVPVQDVFIEVKEVAVPPSAPLPGDDAPVSPEEEFDL